MMKAVICDDERMAAEYLAALLQKKEDIDILDIFTRQTEFLRAMEEGQIPDVVFMDIDWKDDLNGIQLSKKLFEKYPNTQIIYVTGYNDRFSQQIFLEDSNLCGYLVKPVQEEYLDGMLKKAAQHQRKNTDKLVINRRGVVQVLPCDDIIYLESQGHYTILHMLKEDVSIYEKMNVWSEKLPRRFVQCHKSYVVNMDCITYIDKDVIWLKDDHKINISKSRYKEFRERYFQYMSTKM